MFRPEWFRGKDVLDLGCNSGHITLYIAKMLRPARILGLDIDSGLVHAARNNIRHYLSDLQTQEARHAMQEGKGTKQQQRNGKESHTDVEKKHNNTKSVDENGKPVKGEHGHAEAANDSNSSRKDEVQIHEPDSKREKKEREGDDLPAADHSGSHSFPLSLRISRGPIAPPPLTETSTAQPGEFPSNVSFVKVRVRRKRRLLCYTVLKPWSRQLSSARPPALFLSHASKELLLLTLAEHCFIPMN